MKTRILIIALSCSLVACNTLKKQFSTSTHDVPHSALPDDYTVTGTTTIDLQIIQPVRCLDSDIQVMVKIPGALDFRTLNKYEFSTDTNGSGGGGVSFGKQCFPTFDKDGKLISIYITGKPVAPKGSEYRIRSVLLATEHSLY